MSEGIHFPNLLSEFVYTRTYARWLEGEKRRETWPETVNRYVGYIFKGKDVPEGLAELAEKLILNFDVLPSMRALWCAGETVDRDHVSGYNCFAGDEVFVTDRGPRTFQSAREEGEIRVLAGDGQWRKASVHHYGKQPLFKVTLGHYTGRKHGNQTHTVRVTSDHRWILSDGSATTSLKVGDKLFAPNLAMPEDLMVSDAVRHGFVYGDGTINKSDSRPFAQVRLCGKKARLLGELFSEFKHSYPPSYDGDPIVYLGAGKVHWKDLPTTQDPAYVAGFLRGLFLADGCGTGTSGNLRFSTQQEDLVTWVRANAALAGYKFLADQTYAGDTNYGERSSSLHMFILGTGNAATFRVEGIETDGEGDVYCVVEPHTRSFTLANGQVTGNCSFLPVDNLRAFSEALYVLMCGTGVGFSVEREFVDCLPVIAHPTGDSIDYIIQDSTEGWADAVYFGMVQYHLGHKVNWNYSLIREKGARLKTKGGRASGPEPLKRVLDFAGETIANAAGRHLKPIEAHDIMCMIAEIVMVGGFRRASLISFSDVDDTEMRDAKDWNKGTFPSIRYMSNNSAVYFERPTSEVFWREWDSLAKSGSGERGFSIVNWSKRSNRPDRDIRSNPCVTGDTRVMTDRGMVQIRDLVDKPTGLTIDLRFGTDGVGRTTDVGAFKTGTKEVFRLTTEEGYSIRLTADHRVMTSRGWVEAQHLTTSDRVHITNNGGGFGTKGDSNLGMLAGWLAGDGTIVDGGTPRFYFYGQDRELAVTMAAAAGSLTGHVPTINPYEPAERLSFESAALREYLGEVCSHKFRVPEVVWQGTEECQKGYLSSLFTADGCVIGTSSKGYSVRLHSVEPNLLADVQTLLLNFGIASKIYNGRMPEGVRMLPDGKGGLAPYLCKESHELVVTKANLMQFHSRIGFLRSDKQMKLAHVASGYIRGPYAERFTARVASVESCGTEDVYDLTEPTTHSFVANGLVVHNCHEIGLRFKRATDPWTGAGGGGQFCNLSAAVMRPHDTLETMTEKVRVASWLGAIQASYTYFPYLRPAWAELCREDNLLGVDITGQCDNPSLSGDDDAMLYLNGIARSTAIVATNRLGTSRPAAITCGKPSGNSSQFVDCASGFHTRYSKFYFRHVRISAKDPLYHLIRDQGVPVFKENGQEHLPDDQVDVWVARFPVKSPDGAKLREHERALEQLERYLKIMRTWCGEKGHNQSATVYVRDEEWQEVGQWLWDHFDEVTGLSFLNYDESGTRYRLSPYVEITEEEYLDAQKVMPDVDFTLLTHYETRDEGEGAAEPACMGGACSI